MALPTRHRLVAAATDLLDGGGPEAVTLREVGRRAGVSHNAPYKHFAGKEALLAAVAARELSRLGDALAELTRRAATPGAAVREALREYVTWALSYPARCKLVFGAWTTGSPELAAAAERSRVALIEIVRAAQQAGELPGGGAERLTALLRAVVHGAVDLALAGHLAGDGKGRADPDDLVDDLLGYLRAAAQGG